MVQGLGNEEPRVDARPWRQTMQTAQLALGARLSLWLESGEADPRHYRGWLLAERSLLRTTLDAVQALGTPGRTPQELGRWLRRQATALQEAEAAVRVDLEAWGADDDLDRDTQRIRRRCRAWAAAPLVNQHKLVGATALLDAVFGGPAAAAIAVLLERSQLTRGYDRYVALRLRQATEQMPWRRHELEGAVLDDAARTQVALGACLAAAMYRHLCDEALRPSR